MFPNTKAYAPRVTEYIIVYRNSGTRRKWGDKIKVRFKEMVLGIDKWNWLRIVFIGGFGY
jgi:hypothetical protein